MGYQKKEKRWKICGMCGKYFETCRKNQFYCGKECSHEKKLQTSREYQESLAAKKLEQMGRIYTGHAQGLAELNRRARDAGMSYGKYMLSLRMDEQKKRTEGDMGCVGTGRSTGEIKDAPQARNLNGAQNNSQDKCTILRTDCKVAV